MDDKKLAVRITVEVARLMEVADWNGMDIPLPFHFETKAVDLEIALTAQEPHPSFHYMRVFCKSCGSPINPNYGDLRCVNGKCAKTWSRFDVDSMSATAVKQQFFTVENTTSDGVVWPDTLHGVVCDGRMVTMLQPMTREEFVRARVARLYNARQSFRKDFPCK